MKVIVVDDNEDILYVVGVHLVQAGNEVATETDSRKVLSRTDLDTFDWFVLDWMMPHINGYDIALMLQGYGLKRGARILLLTGAPESLNYLHPVREWPKNVMLMSKSQFPDALIDLINGETDRADN
jgi:DNA-binding response OmpR family regulator